ncbi:MAG: hypothetical protein M0036_23310 [Desulfobacteraceae bacterium]|nr:hypothetical protein [Desulfobacteraceae bacterium]
MKRVKSGLFFGVALLAALAFADLGAADEISREARIAAVKATATSAQECQVLGDFYWEMGDTKGALGSGQIGNQYSAGRVIPIASASKWIFGSYVLEKIGRDKQPSREQVQALEMTSGYTGLKFMRCIFPRTVGECFHNRGNDQFVAANVGKFYYNGGHDQKLAIDLGLGHFTAKEFGEEIRKYIGSDLDIDFNTPQPAGGMKASPADYGKFLRKIMSGALRMHDYLGFQPVCTDPKTCPQALFSPVPAAWHYSLNHWVEDSPDDDGAFSSPGAFGFYPWISANKKWYGILARESRMPNAAKESMYCGVKLRRAWVSGKPQH